MQQEQEALAQLMAPYSNYELEKGDEQALAEDEKPADGMGAPLEMQLENGQQLLYQQEIFQ